MIGQYLITFREAFEACADWNRDALAQAVKGVGKKLDIKGKDLYMPLRAALTGMLHGPDILSIVRIRGRDDILGSLQEGICGGGSE